MAEQLNNGAPGSNPDPFPRMFVVCAIIAMVLLAVIFATLIFEFTGRHRIAPPVVPEPVIPVADEGDGAVAIEIQMMERKLGPLDFTHTVSHRLSR